MLYSDLNSGSIIPKSLDFSSPKMWLKCSLYSKNCFFLTSGYLLQASDNLNFFWYPLKVWVVRSRLYFRNPVKGILWTINRDKKNLHYSVYRLYVVVKVYQASSINLISPLFQSLHHYHTPEQTTKRDLKISAKEKTWTTTKLYHMYICKKLFVDQKAVHTVVKLLKNTLLWAL